MNGLLVSRGTSNLSFIFILDTFVTDWVTAGNIFVATIAECFRELLNPRPGDFSASSPAELGETWCKYRLFGGPSSIILKADSLELSFPNTDRADYQIVITVVRKAMENLLPTLGKYARQSFLVDLVHHVNVLNGRVDEYLAHYGSNHIDHAEFSDMTIEYWPAIRFALRTRDGYREFRQTIHQSERLQNGLFIVDSTFVVTPTLTGFDEELSWIKQTNGSVDRAAGISYEREEVDGNSGS